MKNILVDIYLASNLGDDMFFDHLVRSVPEIKFTAFHPGKNYSVFFSKYKNASSFPYSTLDKIKARFGYNKLSDYNRMSDEYDALLFLGGGIFREESYWRDLFNYRDKISQSFIEKDKPVCFSGCNFGPYNSGEFRNSYQNLFKKSIHCSFRDKKSFELFKKIPSVSYAPDFLWSYKLPQVKKQSNLYGISVIDPRHKENQRINFDSYIQIHKDLCDKMLKRGNQIKLFSFCEKEGDFDIANKISSNFPGKIEVHNYKSDIESFLKEIGKCEKFVAARFHAVIIALKFGMEVIPVIYSDKTENLLNDLGYSKKHITLNNIEDVLNMDFLTLNTDKIKEFEIESLNHVLFLKELKL